MRSSRCRRALHVLCRSQGLFTLRVFVLKFLGSAAALGASLCLGIEAPMVHLAACISAAASDADQCAWGGKGDCAHATALACLVFVRLSLLGCQMLPHGATSMGSTTGVTPPKTTQTHACLQGCGRGSRASAGCTARWATPLPACHRAWTTAAWPSWPPAAATATWTGGRCSARGPPLASPPPLVRGLGGRLGCCA